MNYKYTAEDNSFKVSLDTKEGQAQVKKGVIKKEADKISGIIDKVDSILSTVDDLLKSINSDNNASQNSIARILVNTGDTIEEFKKQMKTVESILNGVNITVDNFKNLSYEMKEPDGMVKRLLDPSGEFMFNSLQKSLNSLSIMMDELSNFRDLLMGSQDR